MTAFFSYSPAAMKHWFKDQHFRSLLKNSSYLAMSRGIAAVCSLAALAFAGRGLGVLLFGTLILITSYTRAASGLAKFQSWQLIVRYGGQGLAAGNPELFKSSTGFAAALDIVSGLIGMMVAVVLLPFVAGWAGIDRQYWWLAMLYCTLLPTMGAASPDGVCGPSTGLTSSAGRARSIPSVARSWRGLRSSSMLRFQSMSQSGLSATSAAICISGSSPGVNCVATTSMSAFARP
jgi:hypothetical protein